MLDFRLLLYLMKLNWAGTPETMKWLCKIRSCLGSWSPYIVPRSPVAPTVYHSWFQNDAVLWVHTQPRASIATKTVQQPIIRQGVGLTRRAPDLQEQNYNHTRKHHFNKATPPMVIQIASTIIHTLQVPSLR